MTWSVSFASCRSSHAIRCRMESLSFVGREWSPSWLSPFSRCSAGIALLPDRHDRCGFPNPHTVPRHPGAVAPAGGRSPTRYGPRSRATARRGCAPGVLGQPPPAPTDPPVTIPTAFRRDVRAHLRDFISDDPDTLPVGSSEKQRQSWSEALSRRRAIGALHRFMTKRCRCYYAGCRWSAS